MNYLWLSDEQARQIIDHARSTAPHEACGLIAGYGDEPSKVIRVLPIRNSATDPLHRYEMDQIELSRQLPSLAHDGLELIGFYHSHPTGEPIPSPTDVAESAYPGTAYLIIGFKTGEARLAAWLIDYGRVTRLPLHVGTLPPEKEFSIPEPFSHAQKAAAIISAVLAFVILIALSLLLLPPAPVIP